MAVLAWLSGAPAAAVEIGAVLAAAVVEEVEGEAEEAEAEEEEEGSNRVPAPAGFPSAN